jgi:serine/threonine protein phosphatase PrpC
LILACDGLWDVLTDQGVTDLLIARYLREGHFPDAAEYLIKEAVRRGSTDNITVIVVFL